MKNDLLSKQIPSIRSLTCLILMTLAQACAPALATDETPAAMRMEVPVEKKTPTQVETTGTLKFESTKYQSSIPDNTKLNQSLSASLKLKTDVKTEYTEGVLDFTAEKMVDWDTSQFSVRELYWGQQTKDQGLQVTMGRKLENWSQGDQDWQLGFWQPKQTFDGLRPEQQGLTGVFLKYHQGLVEVLGYGSPIFIPTMEPEVKNDNGTLVSDSRWYRTPSSTFILFNKQRKVVYSLNIPHLEELVNKPGAGLRLQVAGQKEGPWAAVGYAYKPINQLLVKYDKTLAVSEEGEDTGVAPLFPVVAYHSLLSSDVGYKFSRSMIVLSYLADQPQAVEQKADDPYTIQRPQAAKAYTVHADTQLDLPVLSNPLGLIVGYLRVDGGDIADYDAQGANQGAVFSQRFLFSNAAMVQAEIQTSLKNKKLISRFKYMREFDQRGMIGSGEFTLYPLRTLGLTVGADVLGVDDTNTSNQDTSFLNEFRANDRVYAGISYVF
jgi:hypothetical protein